MAATVGITRTDDDAVAAPGRLTGRLTLGPSW